jgi:predicted RNase H-like nuclease (RuvC/YqgF family)
METNQKKGISKGVFTGAVVVLLLLNSVTLYFYMNTRSEKADVTTQKTALQQQFNDLTATFNQKSDELEQFRGKTAELDKAITEKQQQLDKSKRELTALFSKNKLTQRELDKARQMIAEYKASIADMTARVEQLTQQNQELMATNTQLNTDLSLEKSTTSKLTEQNQGLAKKVEVGSLLPIAKLDVEAIKKRNNGKEVPVKRIKAAESLKISFETGANKVLDPGPVSLYVRIINPKGETIAVADQGSGEILSATQPEPVKYTKKADFNYDQNNKKVIVYWSQQIKDAGTYTVEVYQNGYVIGSGKVTLV